MRQNNNQINIVRSAHCHKIRRKERKRKELHKLKYLVSQHTIFFYCR